MHPACQRSRAQSVDQITQTNKMHDSSRVIGGRSHGQIYDMDLVYRRQNFNIQYLPILVSLVSLLINSLFSIILEIKHIWVDDKFI